MKEKLTELANALGEAAVEADALENKHLRDLIMDAAMRLSDAINHPDAAPKPAETPLFPQS